jgi:hypothetical protein
MTGERQRRVMELANASSVASAPELGGWFDAD